VRAGFLVAWLQLNVSGFCSVLARGWHGTGPDPSLVRHSQSVGHRRSSGNFAARVTRSIGKCRMRSWSAPGSRLRRQLAINVSSQANKQLGQTSCVPAAGRKAANYGTVTASPEATAP
jgi:hypothetical protein